MLHAVLACFLDASKVNHDIRLPLTKISLFTSLISLCLSTKISTCVSVGGIRFLMASVSNGVRQGGVLSPGLFTIYIDDLLDDLSTLGVGCYWNSLFAGAMCYADDLAPSPSALRLILRCAVVMNLHVIVF